MTPQKSEPNTQPKRNSKREIILIEAIKLFNNNGFFDTRLEDIALNIGVKKTAISYHYKNKQTILTEAYQASCDFLEQQLETASQEANGLEQVVCFCHLYLDQSRLCITNDAQTIALMSDFSGLPEPNDTIIGERFQQALARLQAFIELGIKDGSIEVQSPSAATFCLFNLIHWIPRWLITIPQHQSESAAKGFCDLITFGMRGPQDEQSNRPFRRRIPEAPAIFDRNVRNQMKRDAILRTGIRHLNHNGYRNLSLDEISGELGVTRGALYYQIPDKESFLFESFNRTFDLIENALEEFSSHNHGQSSMMILERVMKTLFDSHIAEMDPLLRLNLLPMLEAGSRQVCESRFRRILARFSELVGRGIMDGSVRSVDCDGMEHLLLGGVFAASSRRFAVTNLDQDWQPGLEPVFDSESYFEPLFKGIASRAVQMPMADARTSL